MADAAPGGEKAVEKVVESTAGESASGSYGRLEAAHRETLGQRLRRHGGHRAIALIIVVAAGTAGIAGAIIGQPAENGTASAMTTCAAPFKAAEQLTVRTDTQPRYVDLKTEVTVKLGTPEAHDLLAWATSGNATYAASCYFPDVSQAPTFLSAGKGVATFSDETAAQNEFGDGLIGPETGWTGSLQRKTIALQFSPTAACDSDWAGTLLALTVDSDAPPEALSPIPDAHSGSSYTWTFPRLDCKTQPNLHVSVPVSLPTYLAGELDEKTADFSEAWSVLTQWSAQIILLLFAVFFWARNRRAYNVAGLSGYLVAVTALGFAAVAADNIFGPFASLTAAYGVLLALSVPWTLRGRLLIGAAAVVVPVTAEWLANSGPLTADGDNLVLSLAVTFEAVVVAAGVLCAWGRLRRAVLGGVVQTADGRLAHRLDLGILYGGAAIVAAAAFSVPAWLSDFRLLQFLIPPFSSVLIAAALVIPFLAGGNVAGRWQLWYGLLGFAALAGLPDPAIGNAALPVGEVLFAVILARICGDNAPEPGHVPPGFGELRAGTPRDSPLDNARLALKISAVLAIVPVSYFTVTAIRGLPSSPNELAPAFFLAAGIVVQIAGWLAAGLIFSVINTRLPGWCGPVRALVVGAVWFAVGFAVSSLPDWGQPGSGSRSWMFSGLQLLLFLVAFGAVWDACILGGSLSWASLDKLREAYKVQQARALVLYAVPLLLAVIALGQQVLSGSGVEFVQSALNVVPAAFGHPGG